MVSELQKNMKTNRKKVDGVKGIGRKLIYCNANSADIIIKYLKALVRQQI